MDPVTVLTVFLKLAMHIPKDKNLSNHSNKISISRTQIIEIYRKDMNKENNLNFSNNIYLR